MVDDNPDNRETLGAAGAPGPSDIATAADGLEAYESLCANRFDAVLLDVTMPRMGGVVAQRMRVENGLDETPAIMISAETELDMLVRCIELGAEDHLPKPFNPVLLWARLGSVLRSGRCAPRCGPSWRRWNRIWRRPVRNNSAWR